MARTIRTGGYPRNSIMGGMQRAAQARALRVRRFSRFYRLSRRILAGNRGIAASRIQNAYRRFRRRNPVTHAMAAGPGHPERMRFF